MELIFVIVVILLIQLCIMLFITGVSEFFSFEPDPTVASSATVFQAVGTIGILIMLIVEFILERGTNGVPQ